MVSNPPGDREHGSDSEFELPPGIESQYVNLARISHTPADIVLDFARKMPGVSQNSILVRLIMSPVGAKLFYNALGEILSRYEQVIGEIPVSTGSNLALELFKPPSKPPSPPETRKTNDENTDRNI